MSIINPTSKKYAVLIGINYNNLPTSKLNGCINDANNLKEILTTKCGYDAKNMLMLLDDGVNLAPTKKNIIDSFNLLVSKAVKEQFTELWISYSGHGFSAPDANGDEADGRDECICPADYPTSGFIVDDFIYDNLISKLPAKATLIALFDSCHSGTVLDLPYIYSNKFFQKNNNKNKCLATVIGISGCGDSQTSADAFINNKYAGAMTWAFIKTLNDSNYNISCTDLLKKMTKTVSASEYTQIPVLTMNQPGDFGKKFITNSPPKKNLVLDPPEKIESSNKSTNKAIGDSITKTITFDMQTDYFFKESSWNIWSYSKHKHLYKTNNTFTKVFENTITNIALPVGKYGLCLYDSANNGGMKAIVSDEFDQLINIQMIKSNNEIIFDVVNYEN